MGINPVVNAIGVGALGELLEGGHGGEVTVDERDHVVLVGGLPCLQQVSIRKSGQRP